MSARPVETVRAAVVVSDGAPLAGDDAIAQPRFDKALGSKLAAIPILNSPAWLGLVPGFELMPRPDSNSCLDGYAG
ncbi:MAG: hypothetical protein F9K34_02775 [Albidovulum sp.]|uniref:hypothetical protein n=1 Tax=Albidovulum sp. TaxID=1872424 RepID=UPI001327F968|nr:hypothetical protein [Defluviimonas sp.]KAB2886297.1 MAG: hypothetical protein F9K34_02775 [Defluviimonas sp.]